MIADMMSDHPSPLIGQADAETATVVGVKAAMQHWALAVDRVRYSGEPVAVVIAEDRYLAEDALDAIRAADRALTTRRLA